MLLQCACSATKEPCCSICGEEERRREVTDRSQVPRRVEGGGSGVGASNEAAHLTLTLTPQKGQADHQDGEDTGETGEYLSRK